MWLKGGRKTNKNKKQNLNQTWTVFSLNHHFPFGETFKGTCGGRKCRGRKRAQEWKESTLLESTVREHFRKSLSLPIYQLTGRPFHIRTPGTNQNPVLGRGLPLSPWNRVFTGQVNQIQPTSRLCMHTVSNESLQFSKLGRCHFLAFWNQTESHPQTKRISPYMHLPNTGSN